MNLLEWRAGKKPGESAIRVRGLSIGKVSRGLRERQMEKGFVEKENPIARIEKVDRGWWVNGCGETRASVARGVRRGRKNPHP